MKQEFTILSLSGGLGNQLFQFYAACNVNKDATILLEKEAHAPQRNSAGRLSIEDFTLSKEYGLVETFHFTKIFQRIASLNLRISLREEKNPHQKLVFSLTKILLSTSLFLRFRRKFEVFTPSRVGKIPQQKTSGSIYLNGYFQNKAIVTTERSKNLIGGITLKNPGVILGDWIVKAKNTRPIVLHFRIGDYREHPGIGVLDTNYFTKAIERIRTGASDRQVWVFSDDPDQALELLQTAGVVNLLEVPIFSGAETLELMRYGSDYIISNSTFSWWAAVLRYDLDARVLAPKPWFRTQSSPEAIYPDDWQLVEAWQDPS